MTTRFPLADFMGMLTEQTGRGSASARRAVFGGGSFAVLPRPSGE